jgi:hypothetical protein
MQRAQRVISAPGLIAYRDTMAANACARVGAPRSATDADDLREEFKMKGKLRREPMRSVEFEHTLSARRMFFRRLTH